MAFDINKLKEKHDTSDKFFNCGVVVKKIIDTEDFEDKLQKYLESVLDHGLYKGWLVLKFSHSRTDRFVIELQCGDLNIMQYTLGKDLKKDNITHIREANEYIMDKLQELQLKASFNPDRDMENDGSEFGEVRGECSFRNEFIIYLDFLKE